MSTKKTCQNPKTGMKYHVEIHPEFWPNFNPYWESSTPEEKKVIQKDGFDIIQNALINEEHLHSVLFSTKVLDQNGKMVSAITIHSLTPKTNTMQNLINTFLGCIFLLLLIVKCCRLDDSLTWFIVFAPAMLFIVYNIVMLFVNNTDWEGKGE
jgi:hypothetical protein